jgi:hypothetical protein
MTQGPAALHHTNFIKKKMKKEKKRKRIKEKRKVKEIYIINSKEYR